MFNIIPTPTANNPISCIYRISDIFACVATAVRSFASDALPYKRHWQHFICIAFRDSVDSPLSSADSLLLLLFSLCVHTFCVFFSFLFEELKFEHRTLMLMKQTVRMTQMFRFFLCDNNWRHRLTFSSVSSSFCDYSKDIWMQ